MVFIIPELEILKSVTDKNIDSPASKARVKAFSEADDLLSYQSKPVEIVLEGNIYQRIFQRLKEEHKLVFEKKYHIDCVTNIPSYNIRDCIRFIVNQKLSIKKNKIVILTENCSNYPEWEQAQEPQVRVYNINAFLDKIERFKKIKEDYSEIRDAFITSFFIE